MHISGSHSLEYLSVFRREMLRNVLAQDVRMSAHGSSLPTPHLTLWQHLIVRLSLRSRLCASRVVRGLPQCQLCVGTSQGMSSMQLLFTVYRCSLDDAPFFSRAHAPALQYPHPVATCPAAVPTSQLNVAAQSGAKENTNIVLTFWD